MEAIVGWLIKIVLDIFGNKASLVFAGIVIVAIGYWVNSWLEERDKAAVAAVERDQYKAATKAYVDAYNQKYELERKDEKAYSNLLRVNQALEAAKEQAIKELNDAKQSDGSCTDTFISNRERRVLLESIQIIAHPPDDCDGAATGCIAQRLRDALSREFNPPATSVSDIQATGSGTH
jgi:hypothetical protein